MTNDETLQENPWRALAIPKTFRIPQARLPGSYPTSDGFVESDYYRDYSDSIDGAFFEFQSSHVRWKCFDLSHCFGRIGFLIEPQRLLCLVQRSIFFGD